MADVGKAFYLQRGPRVSKHPRFQAFWLQEKQLQSLGGVVGWDGGAMLGWYFYWPYLDPVEMFRWYSKTNCPYD